MTQRIVVVGDTLLDRDIDGVADRLCPDTPAPVLDERERDERPGGAGLAALLARGDDREVELITALAGDEGGIRLSELLTAAGVRVYALPLDGPTPEKVRLRANGQTLLRLDRGGAPSRCGEPAEAALAALRQATVILVSDYGRGLLRQPELRSALATTSAPVVWDPHPRGPAPVPNVRLATPNEAEVRQLDVVSDGGGDRIAAAARGGQMLRQRWRAGAVAVTLGELGALLCRSAPTPLVVPAPLRVSGDTCGAGDRFAVSAATALAAGASASDAVQTAVADATAYVSNGGIHAALTGSGSGAGSPPAGDGARAAGEVVARVRAAGGRVVATGGCFDLLHAGHIATLRAARQLGDCLVVCLNSDASVARLKGPDRPVSSQADRSRVLAALRWVDAVVTFDEPTPEAVLAWLRPDVWVKGSDYDVESDVEPDGAQVLPEAELMRRWDGQAVLVPYLDGHSTTALLAAGNGKKGVR